MSKKIINQVLGLAAIDEEFAQQLLENSLKAIQAKGFSLEPEEQQALSEISASTLTEFCQLLTDKLGYEQLDQT